MLHKIETFIKNLSEHIENDDQSSNDDPVKKMISKYAAICAVFAMLPNSLIPGSDFVGLTLIQCVMARNIAKHYGKNPSFDELKELIKNIGMTMGLAFGAQQLVLSLYRTIVPYWGGVTTFAMVFSATYAVGYVIDCIYKSEAEGVDFCPDNMKTIIGDLKEEGKKLSKDFNPKKLFSHAKQAWSDTSKTNNDKAA
ncbi:hypothetical protein A9Q84_14535 [Halobacteriovorax marinus]|uniref:DUF697 domain-containing protein n=1 Tax=Halobacteriovorax marinus TaxID=97084 RepID=A0A1Y5F8W5_9BACT|nr:hypothetical protein A9Q84_14535 [Halobacteriovorax marinus]